MRSRQRASTTLPFFSLATCRGGGRRGAAVGKEGGTHLGVYAEVLAAGEADAGEGLLLPAVVVGLCDGDAVLHEALELGEGLFDLGDGAGAVDQLALYGEELGAGEMRRARERERERAGGLACW